MTRKCSRDSWFLLLLLSIWRVEKVARLGRSVAQWRVRTDHAGRAWVSELCSESDKELAEMNLQSHWRTSLLDQCLACLAKGIAFVFNDIQIPYLQFERALLLADLDAKDLPPSLQLISDLVFWRQGDFQAVSNQVPRNPS